MRDGAPDTGFNGTVDLVLRNRTTERLYEQRRPDADLVRYPEARSTGNHGGVRGSFEFSIKIPRYA